jgi:LacI family transcriptional regulator
MRLLARMILGAMDQPTKHSQRMTSRHVAELSGVSQTTVSRVLSGHPNVSPRTRGRVLQVLEETGYAPNLAARAMRTGATDAIGVVMGSVTNPFYPMLAEALHREISKAQRTMTLWISDGEVTDSGEQGALHAVRERSVDGVIYTTATPDSASLSAAITVGAPLVLINRVIDDVRCDSIVTDGAAGARAAVVHLAELGHERLGMACGPRAVSTTHDREQGFLAGLAAAGLPVETALHYRGDFTHECGRQAFDRLWDAPGGPVTAIFCVNDVIAFGVLDRARERGVDVPGEISVVGYDDTEQAQWSAYRLTTIRQPVAAMAALGVGCLLERVADRTLAPRRELLPAVLVPRASTGPVPS